MKRQLWVVKIVTTYNQKVLEKACHVHVDRNPEILVKDIQTENMITVSLLSVYMGKG